METAQERELLQLQGWPFHTMAASLDASSGYSGSCSGGGGDSFSLLGWEPPFGCFGVVADAHLHDLFPFCMESLPVSPVAGMESLPVSPAASTAAAIPPEPQDAVAMPEELDDLLLNFWDASSYSDANEQQDAINSSCVLQHEKSSSSNAATATTTTSSSFLYDDDPLGSIFSSGPTLPEEAAFQAPAPAEPPRSSSSSSSHADPQVSDVSGARTQDATTAPSGRGARPPPLPRRCSSSSLKRATMEETEAEAEWSESSGKRPRTAASAGRVVCPFAVLKPDGLDGGATLADINARILMRPARPVRHPVGEFACAPRALSADGPGISGKAVSGFTRLHTPGRGTITIIRTRG